MTSAATPPTSRAGCLRGIVIILAAFLALCTLFAAVITTIQAIDEHAQQSWAQTTAYVTRCKLSPSSTRGGHRLYINCRLSYAAGPQQLVANAYSRYVPGPELPQYPPNQIAPYAAWVASHPPGTPLDLRYNPANPAKIALPNEPLLSSSPHTPQNLKLLAAFGSAFLIFSTVAYLMRPRFGGSA